MRVSSTSEWRLRRIAMYLHKIEMNTRTGVLGSFSIKGVACIFQSGWGVTSCHTQSTIWLSCVPVEVTI